MTHPVLYTFTPRQDVDLRASLSEIIAQKMVTDYVFLTSQDVETVKVNMSVLDGTSRTTLPW